MLRAGRASIPVSTQQPGDLGIYSYISYKVSHLERSGGRAIHKGNVVENAAEHVFNRDGETRAAVDRSYGLLGLEEEY